jgi:hypothetical protein
MRYLQIRIRKHADDIIPVYAVVVAAVLMIDTYAIG